MIVINPNLIKQIVSNHNVKRIYWDDYALNQLEIDSEKIWEYPPVQYILSEDKKYYLVEATDKLVDGEITFDSTYNNLPVTGIGYQAFKECDSIVGVVIPDGVTTIGMEAFRGCTNITKLVIPTSLSDISYYAFAGCTSLAEVYYEGTEAQWNSIHIGDNENAPIRYNATKYYYSEKHPTEKGNYWHYNENDEIEIWCADIVIDKAVIPTCTQTGLTEGSHCGTCGEVIKAQEEVPANGHLGIAIVKENVVAPTCTEKGSHDDVIYCFICGAEMSRDNVVDDALGHDFGKWIYDKRPTTKEGGLRHRECSRCGYIEEENVDKLPILEYELSGAGNYYTVRASDEYVDDLVIIPSTYNNIPVTVIGDGAFTGCEDLECVVIPKSITTIGDYAFDYCPSLNGIYYCGTEEEWYRITVSNIFNPLLETVERYYYSKNKPTIYGNYWYYNADGEIEVWDTSDVYTDTSYFNFKLLDDGTYSIEAASFTSMPATLLIPSKYKGKDVTVILDLAFSLHNSKIASVVIPDSVTSIGSYAFLNCSSLTSVVISNKIESIGAYAFAGCDNLECIFLNRMFYEGISDITIDSTNTNITDSTIYYYSPTLPITESKRWRWSNGKPKAWCWHTEEIIPAIPATCTETGLTRGKKCSKCDEILETQKYVAALGHWWGATTITRNPTCTRLGISTTSCRRCGEIVIDTIPTIPHKFGEWYIYEDKWRRDCTNEGCIYHEIATAPSSDAGNFVFIPLEDNTYSVATKDGSISGVVTIPSTYAGIPVTQIHEEGFAGCEEITAVILPNTITSIGYRAFANSSVITINIPDSVTSLGNECFYEAKSLKNITFGNNSKITEIPYNCFRYCSSLQTIALPSSVNSIGDWAFSDTKISSITLTGNIKDIGECAFQYCQSLTSVELSNGCLRIHDGAFSGCHQLQTVIIPVSVNSIGYMVFADCHDDMEIRIADNNAYYYVKDTGLFDKNDKLIFAGNITAIPSYTSAIGSGAFYKIAHEAPIIIPLSVEFIEALAFSECENVTIYCEAESKPDGWADNWNDGSITVVWGYIEDTDTYLVTEDGYYLTDEQGNLLII